MAFDEATFRRYNEIVAEIKTEAEPLNALLKGFSERSAEHALRLGPLLIEVQPLVKAQGWKWTTWVPDTCGFSLSSAEIWMAIARSGLNSESVAKVGLIEAAQLGRKKQQNPNRGSRKKKTTAISTEFARLAGLGAFVDGLGEDDCPFDHERERENYAAWLEAWEESRDRQEQAANSTAFRAHDEGVGAFLRHVAKQDGPDPKLEPVNYAAWLEDFLGDGFKEHCPFDVERDSASYAAYRKGWEESRDRQRREKQKAADFEILDPTYDRMEEMLQSLWATFSPNQQDKLIQWLLHNRKNVIVSPRTAPELAMEDA